MDSFEPVQEDLNQRLDQYLAKKYSSQSRSQIQKLIKNGSVKVNGKIAKAGLLLEKGQLIDVNFELKVDEKSDNLAAENIPLNIVYEDDDIIVINKDAGMVVHPGSGNYTGTLVNALLHHCKDQLSSFAGSERPGIVHRLDKDTSGLIVCAKNETAHRNLAKQFEEKSAFRVYKALCWHEFEEEKGLIESYLMRHPKDPTKFIVGNAEKGKHAVTRFIVEEKFPFLSLIRFKLETGRTHQIRVHSNYIKHPVFADPVYSGDERQVKNIHIHYQKFAKQLLKYIDRQALHAYRLEIKHPKSNKLMKFEADLPADMNLLLEKLRNKFLIQ